MALESPNSKRKRATVVAPSARNQDASQLEHVSSLNLPSRHEFDDHDMDREPSIRYRQVAKTRMKANDSRAKPGNPIPPEHFQGYLGADAEAKAVDGQSHLLRRSTREHRSSPAQPWWISKASNQLSVNEQPRGMRERNLPGEGVRGGSRPDPHSYEGHPRASGTDSKNRGARHDSAEVAQDALHLRASPMSSRGQGITQTPGTSLAKQRSRPQFKETSRKRQRTNTGKTHMDPAASSEVDRDLEDLDALTSGSNLKFQRVTSRSRRIPRSVIRTKWMRMDEASLMTITDLMSDVSRTVLSRYRGRGQSHWQVQHILHAFSLRLHSKLAKGLPFPPPLGQILGRNKGKTDAAEHSVSFVDEFDFERTVTTLHYLETLLDPLIHSVSLLRTEKEREEEALETDYQTLRTLETNARAEARRWQEMGKRDHPLALGVESDLTMFNSNQDGSEVISRGFNQLGHVFKDFEDVDLLSISQQLSSHMQSMRANLHPVAELLPAMTKGRATLQAVLFDKLNSHEYEKLVLGQ
ncbi:hypothetical protein VTK73DRAFT_9998 [Phialemonium thermophilum]|uniref:Kinetochore protein Mis13/DSN1 n=1 Tax=Phialemonium thermophilum TaxID=223376 RepID=A0ABR3Y5D1_9PEZI